MQLSLLGTGILGSAIVDRLLICDHEVTVWNRTAAKTKGLEANGAMVAASPAAALAASPITLTVLRDGDVTRQVVLGDGDLPDLAQRTIVQMGTIAVAESQQLESEVRQAGGRYLEAPVLGSTPEAKAGTLLLMVGGAKPLFDELSPLLSELTDQPRYIGGVGAAATLKLALNQLLLGLVSSFGLSLAMVKAGGVPVDEFMAVVRQSSLRSPQFEKKLPRMLERDFSQPHFPLSHMLKDVELMQAEAGRLGLGDEALAGMRAAIERSISMGFGQLDYSALYNGIFPAGDEPQ